jgi:fermentation-respiration switch protein FrsA (DUF1100 family)
MSAAPTGGSRLTAVLQVVALRRVPFWERSRPRRAARTLAFGAYCYLGVLIVLLSLENRFLYHPCPASLDWLDPPAGLSVRDVELASADGTQLHAWWAAPPGWKPESGALLYAHGNAGNLSHRGERVQRWVESTGRGVLIFDYPGYGRSTGRPSEASCYAAGESAHAWLKETMRVPEDDVILYGGSLGGAVAIDLATRHRCRALLLVSAFTSFPDMAQKTVPWLPARWLLRNRFDNLRKIPTVRGPVLIAHGTADRLVPFAQGERLFAAAPEPKRFVPLPGLDHNDSPGPVLYEAVRDFVTRGHRP